MGLDAGDSQASKGMAKAIYEVLRPTMEDDLLEQGVPLGETELEPMRVE